MIRSQIVRTYRLRRFRDDHKLVIDDIAEMRDMLDRQDLDDMSRLILVISIQHGAGVMTFGELKRMGRDAISKAGTIKGAIRAVQRKEATASSETIRERLEREISHNPRFKIMKPSGKGYVIGGAKPPATTR
jgi:hypothetical protein